MTTARHDTVRARLEEYALDLLARADRTEVEAHLRECGECTSELRGLNLVVQGLARAPKPEPPPVDLKDRVLARIKATPQVSEPRRLPARDASPAISPAWWLTAAAIVTLMVGGWALWSAQTEARRAAELAQAEAADRQSRLDELARQADLTVSILTAADMRPIQLTPPSGPRSTAARAYWSPTQGLLLVADQLPVPPPGRVYQVWLIGPSGASPVSAGLIGGDGPRRGMLIVPPPPGASGSTMTVAITDEPPGGLPAPSGSIRLVGSL
jgi:anti-sigma-K factor RskA